MRKDRISVSLDKGIIKKLDDDSEKEGRSRSNYIQLIIEKHYKSSAPQHPPRKEEISFKMG